MTSPTAKPIAHTRMASVLVLIVGVAALATGCQTSDQTRDRRAANNRVEHGVLWRGFSHQWGYNHRLNRLGNYVTLAGCQKTPANGQTDVTTACTGQAVHSAATGTGNDHGQFTTHFSTLRSDAVTFTEGNVSLRFSGREQNLLADEANLEVSLDDSLDPDDSYVVLLNGFDLRTRAGSRAKKLNRVRFSVDRQPTVDRAANSVTFRIRGELKANCSSMECKAQKNRVRYISDIRWLMLSTDQLATTRKSVERSYKWDRKKELTRERVGPPPELVIKGKPGTPDAAVGWTELGVDVASYRRRSGETKQRDHWFVEWSTYLPAGDYAADSGTYRLRPDLFFKQWNQETKRRKSSIAKRGKATISGEVTMVQHPDLAIDHRSVEGKFEWRGKSAAARTERAVTRRTFTF